MDYTKEIIVDLWKTGAHKVEMGIKKDAVHQSKSRQFTKDMDIIGEINVKDETTGYVAYRKDPWDETDIPEKRIVIKSFTKGMSWKSSLEQLIAKSIGHTAAADKPLPSFIINLSSTDTLITLNKIFRPKSLGKSVFTFSVVDEKTHELFTYIIETDRFSLGSDWFVYDLQRNKIAHIDGSKFNVGGKYTIRINDKLQTYTRELDQVLILFSTLQRYLEDIEEDLEKINDKLTKEQLSIEIPDEEEMLYYNPRRIKM